MKKRMLAGAVLLTVMMAGMTGTGFAATRTWDGSASTDWTDPANWDTGVPGAGDDVIFPTLAYGTNPPYYPRVPMAGASCLSITFASTNTVTLTLNGTLTISDNGSITLNGGCPSSFITGTHGITALGALTVTNNTGTQTLEINCANITCSGSQYIDFHGTDYISIHANITGDNDIRLNMNNWGQRVTFYGTNSYTGSTTITTGTLATSGTDVIPDASPVSLGVFGYLYVPQNETIGELSGSGDMEISAGRTLTVSTAANTAYDGVISGGGNFTKTGTGAFTLNGNNNYSGTTRVTGGTLNVNGVNANMGSIFLVYNDAVLAGTGTVPGNPEFSNTAVLAPGANNGDNVGTLTFTGDLFFNNESTYRVTVTGGAADRIVVSGTVTLNDVNPNVEIQAGYSLVGLTIPATIMNITGTYATGFDESNLPAGWDIDNVKVGNLIRIIAPAAAPPAPGPSSSAGVPTLDEWGMIVLSLMFAVLGIMHMRKRHGRNAH